MTPSFQIHHGFLLFLAFLTCRVSLCSAGTTDEPGRAAVTPPPLVPRDLASGAFVGYYSFDGSGQYTAWNCDILWGNSGYTWCTSNGYGGCQPSSIRDCRPFTGCKGTDVLVGGTASLTCMDRTYSSCVTDRIFESAGATLFSTWIACGSRQWDLYRTAPTASLPSSDQPSSTMSSTHTQSTPTASPTGNTDATIKSKAWISGPILGGIAVLGIAIIGAVVYKRSKIRGSGRPLPSDNPYTSDGTSLPEPLSTLPAPQASLRPGSFPHMTWNQGKRFPGHVTHELPEAERVEMEGQQVRRTGIAELGATSPRYC